MKTSSHKGPRQIQLLTMSYGSCYYVERIARLESILKQKPRQLQINLIGVGEIPADMALLIRSVIQARSPCTRLVTNARSSLQNGSVLVWLLGDRRLIRDDARVYFRRTTLSEEEAVECAGVWKEDEPKFRDSFSELEPEEIDYARVLELINEFLPVKELAGRRIEAPTLRQFGLLENEPMDNFLAEAFGRKPAPAPSNEPEKKRNQRNLEVAKSKQNRR